MSGTPTTDFATLWRDAPFWVKLYFLIAVAVIVVSLLRTIRLCWAFFVTSRATTERTRHWASILVESTRGLTRATLLLAGAATAVDINDAMLVFGNSATPGIDIIASQHVGAITRIAVSFGLCVILYAIVIVMDHVRRRH